MQLSHLLNAYNNCERLLEQRPQFLQNIYGSLYLRNQRRVTHRSVDPNDMNLYFPPLHRDGEHCFLKYNDKWMNVDYLKWLINEEDILNCVKMHMCSVLDRLCEGAAFHYDYKVIYAQYYDCAMRLDIIDFIDWLCNHTNLLYYTDEDMFGDGLDTTLHFLNLNNDVNSDEESLFYDTDPDDDSYYRDMGCDDEQLE
jgi:hypothetical protein